MADRSSAEPIKKCRADQHGDRAQGRIRARCSAPAQPREREARQAESAGNEEPLEGTEHLRKVAQERHPSLGPVDRVAHGEDAAPVRLQVRHEANDHDGRGDERARHQRLGIAPAPAWIARDRPDAGKPDERQDHHRARRREPVGQQERDERGRDPAAVLAPEARAAREQQPGEPHAPARSRTAAKCRAGASGSRRARAIEAEWCRAARPEARRARPRSSAAAGSRPRDRRRS